MPRLALALYGLYLALAFGWRTWLQLRRTGSSGFVGLSHACARGQLRMGGSWRIGVDPAEKTALVTGGPFAFSRNPIFPGMIAVALGLLLLVPNLFALLAVTALVAGVEIQVRLVEEPYLVKQHGAAYLSWARRTGRFVPGLGRLP